MSESIVMYTDYISLHCHCTDHSPYIDYVGFSDQYNYVTVLSLISLLTLSHPYLVPFLFSPFLTILPFCKMLIIYTVMQVIHKKVCVTCK